VKSGISGQYIYRSLYAAQMHQCEDHIPAEDTLVLVSERMDADMAGTLREVSAFLGVSVVQGVSNGSVDGTPSDSTGDSRVVDSVMRYFPKFENHTGWRLRSSYGPMDAEIERELRDFFQLPNRLLSAHLGFNVHNEWKDT
jgi:hypothetical protein